MCGIDPGNATRLSKPQPAVRALNHRRQRPDLLGTSWQTVQSVKELVAHVVLGALQRTPQFGGRYTHNPSMAVNPKVAILRTYDARDSAKPLCFAYQQRLPAVT